MVAPVAGTVLAVDAQVGQRVNAGAAVVTLADTSQLELTIDVAELDLPQVAIGQAAVIDIDAFSGQPLNGVVAAIAPSSSSSSGVVYYPVTVRLTADDLSRVRPGMTAIATIQNQTVANGWLVPTTAIRQEGDQSVVLVVKGEAETPVVVTTGAIQGEWTIVESPALQAGDQVSGTLASFVNEENNNRRFGPGGGGPPGGGPPGG